MGARDSAVGQGLHVLVVDDVSETGRWVQQAVLAQGYSVTLAQDTESALLGHEGNTCAVILNTGGPSRGAEVVRALRAEHRDGRIIAFGHRALERPKGVLVTLPLPLDARHLTTALTVVRGMKAMPAMSPPRQGSVRPAA